MSDLNEICNFSNPYPNPNCFICGKDFYRVLAVYAFIRTWKWKNLSTSKKLNKDMRDIYNKMKPVIVT